MKDMLDNGSSPRERGKRFRILTHGEDNGLIPA